MAYNLTAVAASTNPLELAQNVNTHLVSGYLGIFWLLGISVVFFLGYFYSTRELRQSIAATTWIAFIMSVFLRAMSLVNDLTLFTALILAAFAVGFIWTSET